MVTALRTACDLEPCDRDNVVASRPNGFLLPSLPDLDDAVSTAIADCQDLMAHTTVTFEDELKKGKSSDEDIDDDQTEPDEPSAE